MNYDKLGSEKISNENNNKLKAINAKTKCIEKARAAVKATGSKEVTRECRRKKSAAENWWKSDFFERQQLRQKGLTSRRATVKI